MRRMTYTKNCAASFRERGSQAYRRDRDDLRLEPHSYQLFTRSIRYPGRTRPENRRDPGRSFLPGQNQCWASLGCGRLVVERPARSRCLQLPLADQCIVLELLC
jgi:hypothetical protein